MKKPSIDIIDLFPVLNAKLILFLENLPADDWLKQTVAKQWKIKDVAAHLLDGNCRQISFKKDGWASQPDVPINSNQDLVDYLNRLNAEWVKATKRLSPLMLIKLLKQTNDEVYVLLKSLDPFAPSLFPVSWAGENESQNWFDIAREYSERWLHQQQIRDAMNDKEIMTYELYHPFLNIMMYAWPFTCRDVKAKDGTMLKTTITGEGGGEWFLKMENGKWKMEDGKNANNIAAETIIDGNVAWKLFSKSVRKEDIKGSFEIKGDQQLGEKILEMVSVMA